ncbi:MAG TPA: PQQ-binding-like beta-propeller repeat protein [Rhizomicrobium sp.]|jgi:hypothetical protein|nr:PQQ-binding-like beta-propeller repeat protein [Rhizomicrobium sp.]
MNRSIACTLFVTTALLSLALAVPAQAVNWENQGYSPGIDGFNPHETTISASNVANLALAWQSSTTDINGVFAMVEDNGRIFVQSNDQNGVGDVVALDSTGAELWKASLGSGIGVSSSGLTVSGGRVFAQCSRGSQTAGLCALSQKTGKLSWFDNLWNTQLEPFGGSISRPTSANGVVFFASSLCPDVYNEGSCSYAVNASSGQVLWMTETPANGCCGDGGTVVPGPAVSPANKLVYVPCDYIFDGNNLLHFFGMCTYNTSDGSFVWNYDSATPNSTGPQGAMGMSVVGNTVYFQESNDQDSNGLDNLSALNAQTGAVLWTFNAPFSYHDNVQPTVAKGDVYFPDGNGTLWALKEQTGATLWSNSTWAGGECSPVGGPNGTESQPQVVNGVVFITTSCSNLGFNFTDTFALAASNGTVLWQGSECCAGNASGAAPIIVNGELYADCYSVCAFTLPGGAHRPVTH